MNGAESSSELTSEPEDQEEEEEREENEKSEDSGTGEAEITGMIPEH